MLSAYLQKAVAEMSNKEREAGGVATDFTKFSEAQLNMLRKRLEKAKVLFYLSKHSSSSAKTVLVRARCIVVDSLWTNQTSVPGRLKIAHIFKTETDIPSVGGLARLMSDASSGGGRLIHQ